MENRSTNDNDMDRVYVVPVGRKYLVHAPWHGVTALVNRAAVDALKAQQLLGGTLEQLTALIGSPPKNTSQTADDDPRPAFLGIIPTRACNLDCLYCGFSTERESPGTMDVSMALSAVDWFAEYCHDQGLHRMEVDFFGGEPFCAPDVVDAVVHRSRARAAELDFRVRFEVDTNGFFDKQRCRAIADYIDVVVLSLDGLETVHDRQRPQKNGRGSYAAIADNIRVLDLSRTELCLRACVTTHNLDHLAETAVAFCRQFHPSVINFEPLKPTARSDKLGLQPPDPWMFAKRFLEAHEAASQFGVPVVYGAASAIGRREGCCPAAQDALIVFPDGALNACYLPEKEWRDKGLDLNLGQITSDGTVALDWESVRRVRNAARSGRRCRGCVARWRCYGGCYVLNAADNQKDSYGDFCIQTRIITTCLLLQRLGCFDEASALVDNRDDLERLVFCVSDRLSDWEGTA